MEILGQSALIVVVAAFSLAITALSRNLRNKVVLSYALLCVVISAWAFCFFLEKIFGTGTFYKLHLDFNLLLAPVGLFFIRVLTRIETTFNRWLYRISIFYTVTVIGLEWSNLGNTPLIRNLAFYGPTFLAIECLYLLLWKKRTTDPRFSRLSWVYTGGLLLLASAGMDHIPQLGPVIPSVGNLLLCLYLFIISEAIILQRLLNIGALLTNLMVLVFISLCFTVIYTIFVAWINNSPALFLLNTFLASFIILILIEPFKKLTNLGFAKIFKRKYQKFEQKLEETQRALIGVLDTSGLAQLSLSFLENTLRCNSATFFILRSDGTKFRRIRGFHDEQLSNREILSNSPLVEFFSRIRKRGELPVIFDQYLENEMERTTSQTQKQFYDLVLKGLKGLNANIAIPFLDRQPIRHTDSVLGFIAVRVEYPPEPWGNNWGILSAIYPFFIQAARLLKNMDVYVKLREKERLATLGEMAAGLAHEIRNPLGAIKGAAQYLEPQATDPKSPFLQVIIEEVNRLNKVVSLFLDYSKQWSVEAVETEVSQILEKTYTFFQSEHCHQKDSNHRIKMELVQPNGGFRTLPHLACAPEQIKQVLVNLVQNSVQSLYQSKLEDVGFIKMGAFLEHKVNNNHADLVLFVEDNGRGIPKENLDKIFIPFFTTSPGGTGLGLPICSKIVEAHGGHIDVISEEGKMTRFSVHLPTHQWVGV